jgi:hypothetical protein
MAALDKLRHLPIEERQQQCAYVATVNVRIGVFCGDPSKATDEIFIAPNRKVVNIAVRGFDRRYGYDGQRHEIAIQYIEFADPRAIGVSNFLLDGWRAGMISPYEPESDEILRY